MTHLVGGVEVILTLAGAWLLWRLVLSPDARTKSRNAPSALAAWPAPLPDFLLFLLCVIGGAIFVPLVAMLVARNFSLEGDQLKLIGAGATQLGMLGAVALYWSRPERSPPSAPASAPGAWRSGGVAFLVSLPLVVGAGAGSEYFFRRVGLPRDRQDLMEMFERVESPWQLALMIVFAVVVAPLTEELVFRAGLFRWLRTRVPRWAALVLPSFFFASLHVNWTTLQGLSSVPQLTLLAVIFSLAYERTGRIGTPIVAHALFNLNTVIAILSGLLKPE